MKIRVERGERGKDVKWRKSKMRDGEVRKGI